MPCDARQWHVRYVWMWRATYRGQHVEHLHSMAAGKPHMKKAKVDLARKSLLQSISIGAQPWNTAGGTVCSSYQNQHRQRHVTNLMQMEVLRTKKQRDTTTQGGIRRGRVSRPTTPFKSGSPGCPPPRPLPLTLTPTLQHATRHTWRGPDSSKAATNGQSYPASGAASFSPFPFLRD